LKRETPLAEILFLLGNGARKVLDGGANSPVGNPKRKV
jgi:hypothetical protein